jgi:hypothetical protein
MVLRMMEKLVEVIGSGRDPAPVIAVQHVRRLADARRLLARSGDGEAIFGLTDGHRRSYLIAQCRQWAGHRVGICVESETDPVAFASRAAPGHLWFIGFAGRIGLLDPVSWRVQDTELWMGPFQGFLDAGRDQPLVAVFEIGVTALDWADGRLRWRLPTPDVVIGWRVSSATLVLGQMEGPDVVVSLADGRITPRE